MKNYEDPLFDHVSCLIGKLFFSLHDAPYYLWTNGFIGL